MKHDLKCEFAQIGIDDFLKCNIFCNGHFSRQIGLVIERGFEEVQHQTFLFFVALLLY